MLLKKTLLINNINFFNYTNFVFFDHELLTLSFSIFLLGFIGFLSSRNFLSILINLEILMLGINFFFITNSISWNDYMGQVYVLYFLAINASETAIALGFLILLYRVKGQFLFSEFSVLKD